MQSELIRELQGRGLIQQATDLDALEALAAEGPITAYIGFDLTADSLHVGSLIQIMMLRWLLKTGHNPIILFGEATTRIGDPTGKDKARPMLSDEDIETNRVGIQKVFDNLVLNPYRADINRIQSVSNIDWFSRLSMMDYLREYGPHFTVNRMLTFDSVQLRLSKQDPMSFLEFNYMLMQAIDFLHLARHGDCVLQIGGSDQWGNIINGVELVRRVDGAQVFGLTTPLMTNAAGEKMGKTANGAIWLSADKTSPFEFYQFWRNIEDAKVEEFLKMFTEVSLETIADVMAKGDINDAKRFLAMSVTGMVHGSEATMEADQASRDLTSGVLSTDGLPTQDVLLEWLLHGQPGDKPQSLAGLFVKAGLTFSNGDAVRTAQSNGLKINGELPDDIRRGVTKDDIKDGVIVLQRGKKNAAVLKVI